MSNRIYTTAFTVPALTAIASPVSLPVVLDDVVLDSVRVIIQPGHAALTGLAIFWSTQQIAPFGVGTWFTGDNELIDYPFDGEVTANGLTLKGYNTDVFAHTFRFRWLVSDRPLGGPVTTSSPQLGSAPASSDQGAIASLSSDTTGQGNALVPQDQASGALVPDLAGGVS